MSSELDNRNEIWANFISMLTYAATLQDSNIVGIIKQDECFMKYEYLTYSHTPASDNLHVIWHIFINLVFLALTLVAVGTTRSLFVRHKQFLVRYRLLKINTDG